MRRVVSPLGRVTISKSLRDRLALRPGDRIAWRIEADGRVTFLKAAGAPPPAPEAPKPPG